MATEEVVQTLVDATEFENTNSELAKQSPLKMTPNTKTSLLLRSHFSRLTLPSTDYLTDTKNKNEEVSHAVCSKNAPTTTN